MRLFRRPSATRPLVCLVSCTALLAGLLGSAPLARAASDCTTVTADGPCGMDLTDAWSHYTKGVPRVLISYIEGGINWHLDTAKTLVDRIFVNWRETPVPCRGSSMSVNGRQQSCHAVYSRRRADYDPNHDGFVNASDWAGDPRVHDANGNGYLDPEDLVVAFSDGVDHDHNGYPSDISGWDFYDHQNDSATPDSTYPHSDNQMSVLHHECPNCMIVPVKAGDEALDRTDDLAQAWLYSADVGARVITSVTADLGYSGFMRDAVRYVARRGIATFESSNDFDSTDHQGGMFWPTVVPGNGVVASSDGSTWERSDLTSWGPHNVLSGATSGGSTSESTPTLAGVTALVLSWGRLAARRHLIPHALSGPEAEQVLIQTATRVTDPALAWPGSPGIWNMQYGYGIPNANRAMQAVAAGRVPPVGRIASPDWYALEDPTTTTSVPVTGSIRAPRAAGFSWTLRAGLGGQPSTWWTIGQGSGQTSFSGRLGTLDLADVPPAFWQAAFGLSQTKELETVDQYDVTLRLDVTDSNGVVGRDRRAISVYHDPTWLSGFPMRLPASGESQPALVDLQGTGHLAMVFGDANGLVHAIDPATRHELPGWPVHTDPVRVVRAHAGVHPGDEAILADVAVGDLGHTGDLSVVATSLEGRVYAWDADGHALAGWPKTLDKGLQPRAIPRPALPFTRLPAQGAVSAPVLFDLQGTGKLDVIQTAWDGWIHAWAPDGSNLPGWPVHVTMPAGYQPPPNYVLVDDQKLDTGPAIAYLQGQQMGPDIVVRPQYTETQGEGIQPAGSGYLFAYAHGNLLPGGWPARLPGVIEYFGSAQEFITEGTSSPVAADPTGTGAGPDLVAVAAAFSPPVLVNGSGTITTTYQGAGGGQNQDAPISFTTSGAFGKLGGAMTFAEPETGGSSMATALLQPASGGPINEFESAFPAAGGPARPGFPADRQGIDFLGAPLITDVAGDGMGQVVDGGDANAITAYDSTGATAPGFPKWTTGWGVYSPSAGDLLSTGKVDLVQVTREAYVMAWATPGLASANTEWWRAGHDEWNTSRYESLTRPPGAVQQAEWRPGSATLTFVAPGASWYSGAAPAYRVSFSPSGTTLRIPATGSAGRVVRVPVPVGTSAVRIQAVNAAGLVGPSTRLGG
jgi:hypothetical protein